MFAQRILANILYIKNLNSRRKNLLHNLMFDPKSENSFQLSTMRSHEFNFPICLHIFISIFFFQSFSNILATFEISFRKFCIFLFLLFACLPIVVTHMFMVIYVLYSYFLLVFQIQWVVNILRNNVAIYYKILSALMIDQVGELWSMLK